MNISIKAIEFYLPEKKINNDELKLQHPDWDMEKVGAKSGVYNRHIAAEHETAFTMACEAIQKLLDSDVIKKFEVDGVIFCTQSPDYIMPSNAFLIHKEFGFRNNVWAFDYNLACSGYVYGLSIVRGMIETKMAKNVLLINSDTYSKYINKDDRSTSVLFGDAATVSLISTDDTSKIIDIELASSGSSYDSFYIPAGGCKLPKSRNTSKESEDHSGNVRTLNDIHMNGFAVWKFISQKVPIQIKSLLSRNKVSLDEIDLFVFHQASKLTLDSLVKALNLDQSKVYTNLDQVGNTVSASIPLALKYAMKEGRLKKGDLILISGFGVGLSWGSLLLKY